MRTLLFALVLIGCKPGGTKTADVWCAKATTMYAKCEGQQDMTAQEWELVLDRWRGLCRAVMTGETKQLLPDGLQIYTDMSEPMREGLRVQAECMARSKDCVEYRACEK